MLNLPDREEMPAVLVAGEILLVLRVVPPEDGQEAQARQMVRERVEWRQRLQHPLVQMQGWKQRQQRFQRNHRLHRLQQLQLQFQRPQQRPVPMPEQVPGPEQAPEPEDVRERVERVPVPEQEQERERLLRSAQCMQLLKTPSLGLVLARLPSLIFLSLLTMLALELIGRFTFLGLLVTILAYLVLIARTSREAQSAKTGPVT
ncbi:hypothetical protein MVEN_02172800 [Mycena venus]|uniref:Uncharacterized protein n=1 Tax=Mycena venus TaxID=2733690 RepID=A0A8H6X8W2_9AGAR|nr:hypothetical protein MVEN_02172800 [Mycena venus]